MFVCQIFQIIRQCANFFKIFCAISDVLHLTKERGKCNQKVTFIKQIRSRLDVIELMFVLQDSKLPLTRRKRCNFHPITKMNKFNLGFSIFWVAQELTLLLCIVGLQLTTLLQVSTVDAQRFYAKLHLVAQLITLDLIEKKTWYKICRHLQQTSITKLLAIESQVRSLNNVPRKYTKQY